MTMIKLRPHHLLCVRGFKGKGYSASFVKNFKSVLRRLEQNSILEIVAGGDEICSACPHFSGGKCSKAKNNDKKVRALDAKVLSKLNLRAGIKANYKQVSKLVNGKIPRRKLREVCGGCEWIEYCEK